jgi:arylsulfatase
LKKETEMIKKTATSLFGLALGTAFAATASAEYDRTHLPIPYPDFPESTVLDVRDATPPERFQVKAPEGAPNVLVVLIDDLGFAGTSAFGGPVPTETFDSIAGQGLKFNNFHTTAVSSPTRAALKSGPKGQIQGRQLLDIAQPCFF